MEYSEIDQAWQLFSALMRNYPLWPSTFSMCDCNRSIGRGGGKCALCLEEKLAQKVGPDSALRATRAMVEMCDAWAEVKERAELALTQLRTKTPNDLGNRRAAFGASVLTDGLAGNEQEKRNA